MNNLLLVKLVLLISLLLPANIFAQGGKISGTVIEKDTEEPLAGVTVFINSIQRGVTTDSEGRYTLLSVPSGSYEMSFSFIGFATQKVQSVLVNNGRTTNVSVELSMEVVQGEEIIVQAERPIVKKDQTSSVSFIGKETIEELPVLEVGDLIKFQPGVVTTSDGGFSFRGGRTREVAYIVDGVPVQDTYSQSGGNTIDVEVQSVQELQVLTGTFDAEIGGAQSGVVNVTTRDPARSLEGNLVVRSGGYYPSQDNIFIGGSSFDPVESKDVSLTLSGPLSKGDKVGFFFSTRYEDRVGYLKGQRRFTSEDGKVMDAYQYWYRNRYAVDDSRLISLDTARTPNGGVLLDSQGNVITFSNGDNSTVNMDWSESITVNPKIVFRPNSRIKLTYNSIYNTRESQGYNDSKRYAPDGRSTNETYSLTQIITYKQSFNSNLILNLRASNKIRRSVSKAFESFEDERYTFFSESDVTTGFYFGGTENGRYRFEEDQWLASGDLTWQVNYFNELKAGFQFKTNRFKNINNSIGFLNPNDPNELASEIRPGDASQYPYFDLYLADLQKIQLERVIATDYTNQTITTEQRPIEFAAFIQDKMELASDLVVKLGLRFEYYDTKENFIVNTRQQAELIGREDNLDDVDPKTYLSPRVGISFPVSDRGAFRVAYGHFTQMPAYSRLFQNPVDNTTNVGRLEGTTIGNPDLIPERTVKYEMGLQQQLSDFIGLDVNLFYKNIRNLLGLEILSTSDGVRYYRTVNRDYGLVKGGTLALFTQPKGFLNAAGFDITYQDAQGSSSNPNAIADIIVPGLSGEVGSVVVDRQIIALDWDQTLSANTYVTFGKPGSWNVGIVNQLATGQPYTPSFIDETKDFPDNFFDNTEKKPLLINLDLSAEKSIRISEYEMQVKLQVNNLINYLNQRTVFSGSGRADQIIRLPYVQDERSFVNSYVGLFTDEEDDVRPTWYSPPRQILISVQLVF